MTALSEELAVEVESDANPSGDHSMDVESSSWRDIWTRFRRNRLALVGLVIITLLVLTAIFAPLLVRLESTIGGIAKLDPETGTSPARLPPSADHWFGTDKTGRDLFARTVYGTRISLLVGFSAVLLATTVGVVFGALAGFFGKWVDAVVMRITDIALALPYIVLAIALVVVFGRSRSPPDRSRGRGATSCPPRSRACARSGARRSR